MKLKNVLLVVALIMGSFSVVNVTAQITSLDSRYQDGVETFVASIVPGTGDARSILPAFSVPAPLEFTSASYALKVGTYYSIYDVNIVEDTLLYLRVQFQPQSTTPFGDLLDTLVISAVDAADFVLPLRGSVVPFDVSRPWLPFYSVLPGSTTTNPLVITTLSQQLDDFDYKLTAGNQGFSVAETGRDPETTISTLTLGVTFTAPTSADPGKVFTDILTVSHPDYPNLIYEIELEATISYIEVSPVVLEFDVVAFGNSVTKSITVTNHGVPINSITFEGSTHFSYVLDSDWDPATGGDIHVTYAPVETIPYDNAGLTFISATDTVGVGFRGIGSPAPELSASTTSYDFGRVIVGDTQLSSWITVILTNTFGSHLTDPGAIVVDDPTGIFRLASIQVEYQGADGDTVFVTVSFKPNAVADDFTATLLVYADEAEPNPLEIELLGEGVEPPAPSLSPQQATAISAAEASVAPVVTVKEGDIVVSQAPQGSSIQVYNLQGVALKTQTVSSDIEVLKTGSFPQSVYIVLVNDQKQVILKKKVLL